LIQYFGFSVHKTQHVATYTVTFWQPQQQFFFYCKFLLILQCDKCYMYKLK